MTIKELSREQIQEVKERFIMGDLNLNISYGELLDIDNIVTDYLMYMMYEHVDFTNDDFFCTAGQ